MMKLPLLYRAVPADTVIRVRMDTELNSRSAHVGDRFSTTVTEPVYGGSGVEVIPVGTKVWGRVTEVMRAGPRTPGHISVAFNTVQFPNGTRHPINGSLTSLETDDTNDYFGSKKSSILGHSDRKRDAVFIGGGAATGAIIGAVAGGGKGAAIGAILGGAAGTGARVYEQEQDAEVKSGTEFGVVLNRPSGASVVPPGDIDRVGGASATGGTTRYTAGDQVDLSGIYEGQVTMRGAHELDAPGRLTITGNRFTLEVAGRAYAGSVVAISTRGYTGAAFHFQDISDPAANTPLAVSARVRREGGRLMLEPVAGSRNILSFTGAVIR